MSFSMTECSDVMSAQDDPTVSVASESDEVAGQKAEEPMDLLKSIGLALPDLGDTEVLRAAWRGLASAPLGDHDTDPEKLHCQRLTQLVAILGHLHPEIGQAKVFNYCSDLYHGGLDSVKPDIVITRGAVTAEELQKPSVLRKVHMLAECKTANGPAFHGQCAKYVEHFGRPGAVYDFVLGVKAYRITVMLFTAKAWAELASFDYRDASEEMVRWFHFLMRDDCPDRRVEQVVRGGLRLFGATAVRELYRLGLSGISSAAAEARVHLSPLELGKPKFSSPGLFGSKTRVWAVHGRVDSGPEETLVVKHSFARQGVVPNGHYFMEKVRWLAQQDFRAGRWMAESLGIWIDDRFLDSTADSKARVGVIQVMRPGMGATWQDAYATASVADILRAARDVVRIIAEMRPFHHRDISLNNLMMDARAVDDGNEALRMEPWLSWQKQGPAPPLVAQVIDFERGRWSDQPSDFDQRKALLRDEPRDQAERLDDVHTGTLPFLPRAQAGVRTLVRDNGEDDVAEMLEWVRENGHHRHWHDIESLLLCVLVAVFSKWRKEVRGVNELLKKWYSDGAADVLRGQWLDSQATQLQNCVFWNVKLDPWKKKVARLLEDMFRAMRPAFEASVAKEDDSILDAVARSFHPLTKSSPFKTVLECLIETIPLVEEVEQIPPSPLQQPSAHKRKADDESNATSTKKLKQD